MHDRVRWQRSKFLRNVAGHVRMLVCVIAGFAAWLAFARLGWPSPSLAGWNFGVVLYLGITASMMQRATEHSIRARAAMIDESRSFVLLLVIIAVAASFTAIFLDLRGLASLKGSQQQLRAGMAVLTIVTSWTLIHAVFAQHYAHEFFIERAGVAASAQAESGGLRFPGTSAPDYFDFLYFSFVIGVASQTADVEITSRAMRRLNLLHCVLTFSLLCKQGQFTSPHKSG